MSPNSSRAAILNLLRGNRDNTIPCFSALSTIIEPALETRVLHFHEIHRDVEKMVTAAASAYELYGWQSAMLPTSLIVEAEAFGAMVDYRDAEYVGVNMPEAMWPLVPHAPFATPQDVLVPQGDFAQRGNIPLVCDALRQLKHRVGNEIVVGAWIAGPFTLGSYAIDLTTLLLDVKRAPQDVAQALDIFADALIATANAYENAGADFITIHEMGGSPGVLGPRAFAELILPRLQKIISAIPVPTILSVCGNTNNAMELLAQSGANALHVEHTNNLQRSREILGHDVLLFGNLDPVRVIANGDAEKIHAAVEQCAPFVDAIMPGCDLYLQTPAENLRALLHVTENLRLPK